MNSVVTIMHNTIILVSITIVIIIITTTWRDSSAKTRLSSGRLQLGRGVLSAQEVFASKWLEDVLEPNGLIWVIQWAQSYQDW